MADTNILVHCEGEKMLIFQEETLELCYKKKEVLKNY